MTLISSVADIFKQAAEYNLDDATRDGSLLRFPDYGQVVMTGDLHGHRRNFDKIVRYCQLESTPIRHVVLHEIVHQEPEAYGASDRSIEVLIDAAKWKTFFPDQVHFLQSNHELAQLHDHEITKGGRIVTQEFDRGVAEVLESNDIDPVLDAIDEFIASLPVAGRMANGILLSHSLPDVSFFHDFNPECIFEPADRLDLSEGGHVYQMVWGRRHTPALLNHLAEAYDVDLFITGHQPQEFGYGVNGERLIILSSDHNHGVLLPIDSNRKYNIDTLMARILPCAGIL
jgi:hypothetical protein